MLHFDLSDVTAFFNVWALLNFHTLHAVQLLTETTNNVFRKAKHYRQNSINKNIRYINQFRSVPLVLSTINLQMSVAVSPLLSSIAISTKALKVALEGFTLRHAPNA